MDLLKATAAEIAAAVRRGAVKASDVAEAHLARARAVEPRVKAFLHVSEDLARRLAADVDAKVARGEDPGPLAGVPVALKDNLCTKGVPTTAGSKILSGFVPPYDATVVERLRSRGAVFVGKTNLDEFAMGSSTENSAFGASRNPWDTSRVPGGSSGGSAAAVAALEATLALGSDTGGSIRQPAALTGLVGLKPTYGLVSRYGLIAFASSLDQIGPLARDCRDAALLLDAIQGRDLADSTSEDVRLDLSRATAPEVPSVRGLRIGVPREYLELTSDPEVRSSVEAALERLEGLGALVREVSLEFSKYAIPAYYIVATAEASSNLARYAGVHYGRRTRRAEDIVSLYARSRSEGFGPEVKRRILLGTFVLSSGFYDAYYLRGQRVRTLIRDDFLAALDGVDVLAGPTSPVPAFKLGERVSDPLTMYACDIFTVSVNLASVPAISIPCGFTRAGLPVGLQLVSREWSDARLLEIGRAFEACDRSPRRFPEL